MRQNVHQHYARQWPPESPAETHPHPVPPGPGPGVNPVVILHLPHLPGDLSIPVSGVADPLDPQEGTPREAMEAVEVLVLRNLSSPKRSIDPISYSLGVAPVHFALR